MKTEEQAHSVLGASVASIWMKCPGQPREVRKMPEHLKPVSGYDADLGTAAHGLLEEVLKPLEKKKKPKPIKRYIGRVIIVDQKGWAHLLPDGSDIDSPATKGARNVFLVDRAMIDSVSVGTEHVMDEIERLGGVENVDVRIEKRVYPLADRKDIFGTSDITISCWPDQLVVIDYKHGAGIIVEIENNAQTLYYSTGSASMEDFSHGEVKMTIVQPRAPHEDGRIRSSTMPMSQILAWQEHMRKRVKATEKPDAPLIAGEHCWFCDFAGPCKVYSKWVSDKAGCDFEEEPETLEVGDDSDPNTLNQQLKWIPIIEAWCRAKKALANRMAGTGVEFEDFKLVTGRSLRKYREDISQKKLLRRIKKFMAEYIEDDKELFTEPVLRSPAQLEKRVPKRKRIKFNNRFVVKPEGALTLAPKKDYRQEVSADPGKDFEEE